MPAHAIFPDLESQIEQHLLRRGPRRIADILAGVRHNGNAAQIHEALRDPRFHKFYFAYHSYRRIYSQEVWRLAMQSEEDYDSPHERIEFH